MNNIYKIIICILIIFLSLIALSSCFFYEEYSGDFMVFSSINNDTEYGVSIVRKHGEKDSIDEFKGVIPKEYNGKPVTSISSMNRYCADSLIIPNNIQKIEEGAFGLCKVKEVIFEKESQLISVGNAFAGNTVIEEILLPDSLVNIGDAAFMNCTSLIYLNIPSKILQIGEFAFMNCLSLKNINFEEESSLETINRFSFRNCKNITKITLPKSIKIIKEFAFMDCENLVEVDNQIESNLEKIGAGAFASCRKLNLFILNENLKIIEPSAFAECNNFFPYIPKNVNNIGSSAFSDIAFCEADTKPEGWDDDWLFSSYIFTTFDTNSIYWGVEREDIIIKDDFIYIKDNGNVILAKYIGTEEKIEIPSQVEGIFVTEIGKSAFEGILLSSVILNDFIIKINEISFWYCSDLGAIIIPQNVDYIGNYAFSRCNNLESVTVRSIIPPQLGENVFSYTSDNLKIYVPAESLDAYKTAKGLSEYRDIIFPFEDN